MSSQDNKPKNTISKKIAELSDAVEWFYGDDFELDAAMERYKSARKLAESIEHDLTQLKNKIEVIDQDFSKE